MSTISPRPSTPNQERYVDSTNCHFNNTTGGIFASKDDDVVQNCSTLTMKDSDQVMADAQLKINVESQIEDDNNIENNVNNVVAPYTFCDMKPNIVDMKRRKVRKASREFNKRRRRSTTNAGGIKSRRSTTSSSTSLDDFDEVSVTSPLTLELQELLSDVIKSVAERLDRVEEEEQEIVDFSFAKEDFIRDNNCFVKKRDDESPNEDNPENEEKAIQIAGLPLSTNNLIENLTEKQAQNFTQTAQKEIRVPTTVVDSKHVEDLTNMCEQTQGQKEKTVSESIENANHIAIQSTSESINNESNHISSLSTHAEKDVKNIPSLRKISKRRSTVEYCQSREAKTVSDRVRRSSADNIVNLKNPKSDKLEQIQRDISINRTRVNSAQSDSKIEVVVKKVAPMKRQISRPSSLDLSDRFGYKRRRLSGSVTPDPDIGLKVMDFLKSSDCAISEEVLESPQESFYPAFSDTSLDRFSDEDKRVNLSCHDFEDEIAACHDFEEVEVEVLSVIGEEEDDELHEEDPLALSDKDVSSPTPDYCIQDLKIDLLDLFGGQRLASFTCCGCRRPYSQDDSFTFDLKAGKLTRQCPEPCLWWTSRSFSMEVSKY